MTDKISIEQANPFIGCNKVISSIESIERIRTNVVFKSDKGLIVSLPNDDTSLLAYSDSDDLSLFELGDRIDVYTDSDGNICRYNDKLDLYKSVLSKAREGHIFSGKVLDTNNKGLIVSINGLQSFLPKGEIGYNDCEDLGSFIGMEIDVKLISIKLKKKVKEKSLLVVSNNVVLEEQYHDKMNSISKGDIIKGTVKSIAKYGVFVTLYPTIDGLIHISDLSWEIVSDPAEIVSVGQNVDVVVLNVQQSKDETPRISLGLKQLSPNPWELFDKQTKVGDIITGKIRNITDYGLFISLPCGVRGLVHKTELLRNPNEYQIGETITAKILDIDWKLKKLSLSIKQLQSDPWNTIDEQYSVGEILNVTIKNITNFGLFVKIEEGLNGLIHISELSWVEKVKNLKERYTIGEHMDAIILKIDKEKRRLELSHKRIATNPWDEYNVGQLVDANIESIDKRGIHVRLPETNLPALIPASSVSENIAYEIDTVLHCSIKSINKKQKIIILVIE